MKLKLPWIATLAAVFILCGPQQNFAGTDSNSSTHTNAPPSTVRWHTIEVKPRRGLPKIHFYQKLNPVWWLKNADEPTAPKWYRPNDKHRNLKWSFRNPLHNFNSYVIGVADKKFARSGRFPEGDSNPRGGWDFEATHYKFIWLPFISFHWPKFDFYLGWRDRGNFGIKININPAKSRTPLRNGKGVPCQIVDAAARRKDGE